jgi:TPR repeat protein
MTNSRRELLKQWGGIAVGLAVVLAVPLLALLENVLKALEVPSSVLAGIGIAGALVTVVAVVFKWRDERRAKERAAREAHRLQEEAFAGALALDPPLPLPRVREVDPYKIGVRWSALTERFGYARDGSERRPPYLRRLGFGEERLEEALRGQAQFVLVRGDSSAGKSRMAFEAALRTCAESQMIVPRGPSGLRTLLELDPGSELESDPVILWLDELDGYLGLTGSEALTADRLARFRRRLKPRRVVVLATTRDIAMRALQREDNPLRGEARALLDQVLEIELKQDASIDETDAAQFYAGADLSAGVGRYLTATDELIERYETGRQDRSDEAPRESQLGVALLRAAIDCRRAGDEGPLPREILFRLAPVYLEDAYFTDVEAEAALAWARVPVSSGVRPLVYEENEEEAGFRVADPLLDYDDAPDEHHEGRAVPVEAWRILVSEVSEESAVDVGFAALDRHELEVAEAAGEKALAAGGLIAGTANSLLALVADERGDEAAATSHVSAAERLWFTEAETGNAIASFNLAVLLDESGDPDAERWYRQAAEAGYADALNNLGVLLDKRGDPEADVVYRRAADAGTAAAALNLGIYLEERGDPEAESWYRQAAEAGQARAAYNLGVLLHGRGDAEAEQWFRRAAEAGHASAAWNLALLLAERQDPEEERWLRKAAMAGSAAAANSLGGLLRDRGDSEAEPWFRQAAEAGHADGANNLGVILDERGDPEAERWFRQAAAAGNAEAANNLGFLFHARKDSEAAERWLRRAADAGLADAAVNLGVLFEEREEPEEAERWYRTAAEAGRADAANNLGVLLYARGEAEAERWFMQAAEAGDPEGANNLGVLLEERGDPEAERWFRLADEVRLRSGDDNSEMTRPGP